MQTTNCIKLEAKKPIKEPVAAFRALLWSLELFSISPINAPTNGPMINPKGMGAKMPTSKPIFVPQMPYALPPNFLVPFAGITKSKMLMTIVMKKVMPKTQ